MNMKMGMLWVLISTTHIGALVQPGENLWHLCAGIQTEADIIAVCCDRVNSKIDILLTGSDSPNACQPIALEISSNGTTITESGVYCLANDVFLGGGSTISIAATTPVAGNVTLDLNGHTVSGGDGISVANGQSNIVIQNGAIQGSASFGLQVSNTSNVIIQNVRCNNCTTAGFQITGNGTQIVLKSCMANANTGPGFDFESSPSDSPYFVQSCIATNNTMNGFLVNRPNGVFENCKSANNAAQGFLVVVLPANITFNNCIALQNTGVSGNGFDIEGDVVELNACESTGNSFVGYFLDADSIKLTNCSAITNAGGGFGADSDATNCLLENCTALGNASGSGFDFSSAGTLNVVKGCTATSNSPFGFNSGGTNNALFFLNSALNNATNYAIGAGSFPPVSITVGGNYGANLFGV